MLWAALAFAYRAIPIGRMTPISPARITAVGAAALLTTTGCAASSPTNPVGGSSSQQVAINGWTCSVGMKLFPNIRMALFNTITFDGPDLRNTYHMKPPQFELYVDRSDEETPQLNASWVITESTSEIPQTPDAIRFALQGRADSHNEVVFISNDPTVQTVMIPSSSVKFVGSSSIEIEVKDKPTLSKIVSSEGWEAWSVGSVGNRAKLSKISLPPWRIVPLFFKALKAKLDQKKPNASDECTPIYYPDQDQEAIINSL